MKKILIIFVLFFSCNKDSVEGIKRQHYINEPGTYAVGKNRLFIRELINGSLIFGIVDSRSNILYQSNSFTPFSKYQEWGFYIDSTENIWLYNSDFQEYAELIKDSLENGYTYKKLNTSTDFPVDFRKIIDAN
jgi:hypothetical protein